jgi:hypothetical protein
MTETRPPPFKPGMPVWLRLVVVAFPLFFAVLGLGIGWDASKFLRSGTASEGEIISIRYETTSCKDSQGRTRECTSEWPTVRYWTLLDGEMEAEVEVSHGYGDRAVGDTVRVRYLDDAPWRVRLARGFWDMWGGAIGFFTIGTLFTAGLVLIFRKLDEVDYRRHCEKHGIDPR